MLTFRDLLIQHGPYGQRLSSDLKGMYEEAEKTWLGQMGARKDSTYTGLPHIRSVEESLDRAVSAERKEVFSATEAFVLLASVLVHDIGKLDIKNQSEHGGRSCARIMRDWAQMKIPTLEVAKWLAILACSHTWTQPKLAGSCPLRKGMRRRDALLCDEEAIANELEVAYEAVDGPVRLQWLAALLRLGDEVDDQMSRIVPKWLRTAPGQKCKPRPAPSWRRHVSAVVFDAPGGCIRLLTRIPLEKWTDEELLGGENGLSAIDCVLSNWAVPLHEIGLSYAGAYLDVSMPGSSLYGVKQLQELRRRESVSRSRDITDSSTRRIVCANEPTLRLDVISRVQEAMLRLHRAVIAPRAMFSWEALAEESGINDVGLVQTAVRRIRANLATTNQHGSEPAAPSDLSGDIACSYEGWRIGGRPEAPSSPKSVDRIELIHTGIRGLDDLLAPDLGDKPRQEARGGFFAPTLTVTFPAMHRDRLQEAPVVDSGAACVDAHPPRANRVHGKWLSPVIAVEGGSGEGKTTLSLQIACNLIRHVQDGKPWTVLYYSLEQQPGCILQQLRGHRYFAPWKQDGEDIEHTVVNLEDQHWPWFNLEDPRGKMLLPRLTPRPTGKLNVDPETFFETRYGELEAAVLWAKAKASRCFVFLDSLTAFSHRALSRSAVHRVFSLFRNQEVPLLVTLERQRHWFLEQEATHFNVARYLADVIICLDSDEGHDGYYRQTIAVTKTRYNRRILGKHLMKIKSTGQQATLGFDNRCGVVVYPSLDFYLVQSRSLQPERPRIQFDVSAECLPLNRSDKKQTLPSDTCIVITGPHGGHKFAVAVNLLFGTTRPAPGKLIVSFAEEREMKLQGVALLENLQAWRDCLTPLAQQVTRPTGAKVWEQQFGIKGQRMGYLRLLNFRMGKIMPEEFLFIFDEYLKTNPDITSILFTDTAQLRTRFPLLAAEAMFVPAMIDIIKSRRLFSVFVDVMDEGRSDASLLAAADCRVMMERTKDGSGVFFRVDNVRGKDYDREARLVTVNPLNNMLVITRDLDGSQSA